MNTYLFALVDGGGTVPPELGVARLLHERGHRVVVLAEDSMRADVESTGATFRAWVQATNRASRLPEDDPYRDWECTNPLKMFVLLLDLQFVGPAPAYAADTTAAIADVEPDLVVCSMFAMGAMAAAEAARVPFDVLFPNIYLLPAGGQPPIGFGLSPAHGPVGRLRDRTVAGVSGRLWAKGLPGINALRASLGLEPVDTFFDHIRRARRHLVLTSPEFDFTTECPENVRYVGPVLDDPAWAQSVPWSAPAGDNPLVLVALSSTFQDQADCLQRIVTALGDLPVRGIVTTGPALSPDAIEAPANVTVVAAAPHSQILAEAAAVLTHGGHGTVVRALAADVPLVILPHGRDQADNAVRVTTRGAGITLSRNASSKKIAAAVRNVVTDGSYRAGARSLGASIRRDAAGEALVAELEDIPQAVC